MKVISPTLEALLSDEITSICRLWTIERKDGTVFYFTDHDRNITFEANEYIADNSFEATAVQTAINSAAADLDVNVLLSDTAIKYDDVVRGMYDEAPVTLKLISWRNPAAGVMDLFAGRVTSADVQNRRTASLQLKGGLYRATKPITEQYSATCRASFGDDRCKFNLATVTDAFTVGSVGSVQQFTAPELVAKAVNWYILGTVTWLTGDNVGTRVEVAANAAGAVTLMVKPPFAMQVGDTGTITRGCSKTLAACNGYANRANYRGEPYVPGDEGLK